MYCSSKKFQLSQNDHDDILGAAAWIDGFEPFDILDELALILGYDSSHEYNSACRNKPVEVMERIAAFVNEEINNDV